MAERPGPRIYSIAAHRGFADALVAGLVPRYGDGHLGLARLTLLLPSARAAQTVREAFIRHAGQIGVAGLLLPRMVVVGDLDHDERLGPLFDSLGAGAALPPAADPVRRWLRLAQLIGQVRGAEAPTGSALLKLARETGRVMDRLLVEEIAPEDLMGDRVLALVGDLSGHWQRNLNLFAKVQILWQAELAERGELDAAARRNRLFREAARRMRDRPPPGPFVAAGVNSAAPALAALLATISRLPQGAVILPDFDLTTDDGVWEELGHAGDRSTLSPFARGDAITHPQYHLKLLLNRMGIARGEVRPWHRAGMAKGPPERSHAIASVFLPPEASRAWADLPARKRRLAGVRLLEAANPEAEAQAVALLVREALEVPRKRVAVITPDRGLGGRIVQHLARWGIVVDDSAGQPLSQTSAGRVLLLLAQIAAEEVAPVPLIAVLGHPLAGRDDRLAWLDRVRRLDLELRGPRRAAGLANLREPANRAGLGDWWGEVEGLLAPLLDLEVGATRGLADWLDRLAEAGEGLCGEDLWAREDGRALAGFVEALRMQARAVEVGLAPADLPVALREAMDLEAVRAPYGAHPRVAIYGLLEARLTRADLVICAGLNEGVWPPAPLADPLLAPPVLRALGVPGGDFRIGLAAHDLASALGAPQVVLSRAARDGTGPAIPSRFLLRVRALLGQAGVEEAQERRIPALAAALDPVPMEIAPYPPPAPRPTPDQRPRQISVTGIDRLRSAPFEFYAARILQLPELEALDADPGPAWQGQLAHAILERWHKGEGSLEALMDQQLGRLGAHPMLRALWRPRLGAALQFVAHEIARQQREPVVVEQWGQMELRGVRIMGKADRIDRLSDGTIAIVDYKMGKPPSGREAQLGYALQLGTLGLIVRAGGYAGLDQAPRGFEYWSLGRSEMSGTGFGFVDSPLRTGRKHSGIAPEDFLPEAERFLNDALDRWILGDEPFAAAPMPGARSYHAYDQLARLGEWLGREAGPPRAPDGQR